MCSNFTQRCYRVSIRRGSPVTQSRSKSVQYVRSVYLPLEACEFVKDWPKSEHTRRNTSALMLTIFHPVETDQVFRWCLSLLAHKFLQLAAPFWRKGTDRATSYCWLAHRIEVSSPSQSSKGHSPSSQRVRDGVQRQHRNSGTVVAVDALINAIVSFPLCDQ